jgi:hypothetical protein
MPKLTRKQLDAIVKKQMPGYRIVEEPTGAGDAAVKRAKPDASAPATKVMREKYRRRGPGTPEARRTAARRSAAAKAGPKTVVRLAPERSADAAVTRERPKVIIVSGKGRITSAQG